MLAGEANVINSLTIDKEHFLLSEKITCIILNETKENNKASNGMHAITVNKKKI